MNLGTTLCILNDYIFQFVHTDFVALYFPKNYYRQFKQSIEEIVNAKEVRNSNRHITIISLANIYHSCLPLCSNSKRRTLFT